MFAQIIGPLAGSLALSAIGAALPLVVLFVMIVVLKAAKAIVSALALSMVLAVAGWTIPLGQAHRGPAEGIAFGLIPILWILANELCVYRLTMTTSWFKVPGQTLCSVSGDHRVLPTLIPVALGAPTAFGAMDTPIIALNRTTKILADTVAKMAAGRSAAWLF
jgi:lactate permease